MKEMSFLDLCYISLKSPLDGLSLFHGIENSAAKLFSIYMVGIIFYAMWYSVGSADFSTIDLVLNVARFSIFVFGLMLVPSLWISFSLYFVGAKKGFFDYYSLMLWSTIIFISYSLAINAILYFLTATFGLPPEFYLPVFASQMSILLVLSICSSVIAYKISYFRSISGHLMGISVFVIVPFFIDAF